MEKQSQEHLAAPVVLPVDLRDYFAAKAIPQAWAAELADLQYFNEGTTHREVGELQVALRAYQIADAMMKAREQ